jgi:hypothetical protein
MGRFSGTDGVGLLWYRREDYPRLLTVMLDARDLPASFEHWQERVQEAVSFIESEGGKPIRVEADLDKIINFCLIRGLRLDAEGRNMFASDPANWPTSSKH